MQPVHHAQPQHDDIDAFMASNENGEDDEYAEAEPAQRSTRATLPPARAPARNSTAQEGPVVQGITLISTRRLPDRFRSIFAERMLGLGAVADRHRAVDFGHVIGVVQRNRAVAVAGIGTRGRLEKRTEAPQEAGDLG